MTLVFIVLEIAVLYLLSRKISQNIYLVFLKVFKNRRISIYFFSLLFLPGTIIHELSHFFAALFTLVPIAGVDLMPRIEGDNVQLGSVRVAKTDLLRSAIISFAPFVVGITLMLAGSWYILQYNLYADWIIIAITVYFIFQISNTMFLSRSDLKGGLTFLILMALIYLVFLYLGIDIKVVQTSVIEKLLEFMASLLIIPIVVDALLVGLIKLTGY